MFHRPPLSQWATASQLTLPSACAGAAAIARGAPTARPAMATRAMVRVARVGLRCLPELVISLSPPAPAGSARRGRSGFALLPPSGSCLSLGAWVLCAHRTGFGAVGSQVLPGWSGPTRERPYVTGTEIGNLSGRDLGHSNDWQPLAISRKSAGGDAVIGSFPGRDFS